MPKVTIHIHTRPPMQRVLQIHERIQQSRFPNCQRMAEEFEVSSRTIKRDIDFMKCRLNLPIEYDYKHLAFAFVSGLNECQLFDERLTKMRNILPAMSH